MAERLSGAHKAVGELLRRYREIAGLSQEALAERAGLSPRGLLYLERGLRRPYPDTLRRLADALALSAEEREALALAGRHGGGADAGAPPAAGAHAGSSDGHTSVSGVGPGDGAPSTAATSGAAPMDAPTAPGAGLPGVPGAPIECATEGAGAPTPGGPRHNLPAALSSFIGREQARARVHDLLTSHRLVTLTGPGGVGKTRLALTVAEGLLEGCPDGVWLVELAALSDPALVPGAVAAVLGLREEPGRAMTATLRDFCRERRMLLLLDNCEHLLAACTALAGALLRAAPALRLLATSREALGVAGEHRYRVASLSVPDPAHLPSPELAGAYEAVRLFVARAQERRDSFSLGENNARAVAEVCARLDGLPLAIELAAARVGSLSVQSIAAHLDDRFRLLSTGSPDLPTRQRTLRAALDWSWDLLRDRERTLLGRLSVFAGGCTLPAAAAVCAGRAAPRGQDRLERQAPGPHGETQPGSGVDSRPVAGPDGLAGLAAREPERPAMPALDYWAVVDGLDALVNRSLVLADESADGTNRYRLLESVRQHAAEQLDAAGEQEATRDRHLAYFLEQAEQAVQAFRRADMGPWMERLDLEHDNMRAALMWAREGQRGEQGLLLAASLAPFWEFRGYLAEGRRRVEEMLATARDAPGARVRALNAAGFLAMRAGDARASLAPYQESLALAREIGDTRGINAALSNMANTLLELGEYARAEAAYAESLELCRAMEDEWGVGTAFNNLAAAARLQGQYERAEALANESLALRRAQNDPRGVAEATNTLAVAVFAQGHFARAADLFTQALALSRDVGDMIRLLEALEGLAWVAAAQGRRRWAARLSAAAEAERERLGMPTAMMDQPYRDQAGEAMRATLGAEAFAAAWADGREMTLAEATALALAPDPAS